MSRFHSYRKRKPTTLAVILILLAIVLSFSALRDLFGLRSVLQSAIYPFQYAAVTVWHTLTGIPASVGRLRSLADQNSQQEKKIAKLRAKLLLFEGLKQENERLRSSLGFEQKNPYGVRLLPAQVIGRSPTPWFSILEINQGRLAGVKKGRPVITPDGLAGQVIEVTRFSSKVLLLIDQESSVAAVAARSRDLGVLSGTPSTRLIMKYVAAGGDIRVGDKITTSQISAVFPPGILIGTVARAAKGEHDLFYHIEVAPAVDFSKLEEIFVIL